MNIMYMYLLAFFGLAAVVVVFLFLFPTVLHVPHPKPLLDYSHTAHRGGLGEQPENSRAAFLWAISEGSATCLELDVWLARDDTVVISHDDDLTRVSQGAFRRRITGSSWDELKECVIVGPQGRQHAPLYRLCDLLSEPWLPSDISINLDLKQDDSDARLGLLIDRTYALFAKHHRLNRLCWGSFRESTRQRALAAYPEVATCFSMSGIIKFYLSLLVGFGVFRYHDERVMCLPIIRSHFAGHFTSSETLQRVITAACRFLFYNPAICRNLEKRGILLVWWTVNSEDDLQIVRRSGSRNIMTDFPSRIRL